MSSSSTLSRHLVLPAALAGLMGGDTTIPAAPPQNAAHKVAGDDIANPEIHKLVSQIHQLLNERAGKQEVTKETIKKLVAQLDDDSDTMRKKAREELIAIGRPAQDALTAALSHGSAEVKNSAKQILARFKDKDSANAKALVAPVKKLGELAVNPKNPAGAAVNVLIKTLAVDGGDEHNDQNTLRRSVIDALADIGPAAQRATPDIIKAIENDPDTNVLLGGYWALSKLATIEQALPTLQKGLKDEDQIIRHAAIVAIKNFGIKAEPAIPDIIGLLRDDFLMTREEAIKALFRAGQKKPEIVMPILLEKLEKDKHKEVRSLAALAASVMGRNQPDVVVPALVERLLDKEEDDSVQLTAIDLLGKFPPKAQRQAVLGLLEVLGDTRAGAEYYTAKQHAAKLLGNIMGGNARGTFPLPVVEKAASTLEIIAKLADRTDNKRNADFARETGKIAQATIEKITGHVRER